MKIWFLIMLAAAMWLSIRMPLEKTDIERLSPVTTVLVEQKAGRICVRTDQSHFGTGNDLSEALEDMEMASPGMIFLDTVEHLVISEGVKVDAELLEEHFRPGTYLCVCRGEADPADAAEYLRGHDVKMMLREFGLAKEKMPLLTVLNGRYYLDGETRN